MGPRPWRSDDCENEGFRDSEVPLEGLQNQGFRSSNLGNPRAKTGEAPFQGIGHVFYRVRPLKNCISD